MQEKKTLGVSWEDRFLATVPKEIEHLIADEIALSEQKPKKKSLFTCEKARPGAPYLNGLSCDFVGCNFVINLFL